MTPWYSGISLREPFYIIVMPTTLQPTPERLEELRAKVEAERKRRRFFSIEDLIPDRLRISPLLIRMSKGEIWKEFERFLFLMEYHERSSALEIVDYDS